MRVLVCGGRNYRDRDAVYRELDARLWAMSALICGAAPGADTLAWDWGRSRDLPCERFPADWRKHGRAAGPIRNQRMIDEGKPDIVLAFSGGRGTTDMIDRARRAGISVVEISS